MGYKKFGNKSKSQLQRHIRAQAENSSNVVILIHASVQMKARFVSRLEVLECLRNGVIVRTPEPDLQHDALRCRMEHYIGGRNCMAIVSLRDEAADLIVVTVMTT